VILGCTSLVGGVLAQGRHSKDWPRLRPRVGYCKGFKENRLLPGLAYQSPSDISALVLGTDALLAFAYSAITAVLLTFMARRPELKYRSILLFFVIFSLVRVFTHLVFIVNLWYPVHELAEALKIIATLLAVGAAVMLLHLLPRLLSLTSPAALEQAGAMLVQEVLERAQAQEALREINKRLEQQVAERTSELVELDQNLIQAHARFAMATDAIGVGLWTYMQATDRFQWDEKTHQLNDVPLVQWLRPAQAFGNIHPDDRERVEASFATALAAGSPFEIDYRVVHQDGRIRYLKDVARLAVPSDGSAPIVQGMSFDVTQLKQAEELFRLAIEAAPTGMLLVDGEGRIVMVNTQIAELFQYGAAELVGERVERLLPRRFRNSHPEQRSAYFAAPKSRKMGAGRELYGVRKDGTEVPIEIGLNPVTTAEGRFVLSSVVDLTQAREVDRLRTDFISTVSHELRTPLTSITGALGLMQGGAMGELPAKIATMLRVAYKNSERLERLIDDILDMGKLEAGELSLVIESVNVADFVAQALESNVSYADTYKVALLAEVSEPSAQVLADPHRLMQVLSNLLSNAVKFSPTGAIVVVRASSNRGMERIEVKDTGPGIPLEFRDRIFDKFSQADASSTRSHEGTGLGLCIARHLVEAMGGSIGFDSVLDQGSIFFIELPRANPHQESGLLAIEGTAEERVIG
jgi:PAS domain S-box-containing protein